MKVTEARIFLSTFPRRERPSIISILLMRQIFLSTFPRRERRPRSSIASHTGIFLSTFPRRERRPILMQLNNVSYFYPRSHVGNDRVSYKSTSIPVKFLSTFPRRERLNNLDMIGYGYPFLSTFPRRERPSAFNRTC